MLAWRIITTAAGGSLHGLPHSSQWLLQLYSPATPTSLSPQAFTTTWSLPASVTVEPPLTLENTEADLLILSPISPSVLQMYSTALPSNQFSPNQHRSSNHQEETQKPEGALSLSLLWWEPPTLYKLISNRRFCPLQRKHLGPQGPSTHVIIASLVWPCRSRSQSDCNFTIEIAFQVHSRCWCLRFWCVLSLCCLNRQ